jgi:hypothetical protein
MNIPATQLGVAFNHKIFLKKGRDFFFLQVDLKVGSRRQRRFCGVYTASKASLRRLRGVFAAFTRRKPRENAVNAKTTVVLNFEHVENSNLPWILLSRREWTRCTKFRSLKVSWRCHGGVPVVCTSNARRIHVMDFFAIFTPLTRRKHDFSPM